MAHKSNSSPTPLYHKCEALFQLPSNAATSESLPSDCTFHILLYFETCIQLAWDIHAAFQFFFFRILMLGSTQTLLLKKNNWWIVFTQ